MAWRGGARPDAGWAAGEATGLLVRRIRDCCAAPLVAATLGGQRTALVNASAPSGDGLGDDSLRLVEDRDESAAGQALFHHHPIVVERGHIMIGIHASPLDEDCVFGNHNPLLSLGGRISVAATSTDRAGLQRGRPPCRDLNSAMAACSASPSRTVSRPIVMLSACHDPSCWPEAASASALAMSGSISIPADPAGAVQCSR